MTNSCHPTWRPKTKRTLIMLNVAHSCYNLACTVLNHPFSSFLWFVCKNLLLKAILYMHKNVFQSRDQLQHCHFLQDNKSSENQISVFLLIIYHRVSVFQDYNSMPAILRRLRSRVSGLFDYQVYVWAYTISMRQQNGYFNSDRSLFPVGRYIHEQALFSVLTYTCGQGLISS